MVAHSRAGPAVGFNEPEALSKELENAFNEFERSHRNRLVARNDFAHRKDHQQAVRRSQPRMLWGERKAWHDADREELLEGMRLTRNLVDAEDYYRDAATNLRNLSKKVPTDSSSHLSSISTVPPSVTLEYTTFVKERDDFEIAMWRATVLDNDGQSIRPWTAPSLADIETISTASAEYYDGWSGIWDAGDRRAFTQ